MKCCSFGRFSFSYLYILFTALLFVLKSCILSFSELSVESKKNIFGIEPVILKHGLMKLLIESIGYIVYGFLFLCIFSKKKVFKKKEKEKNTSKKNQLIFDNTVKKAPFRTFRLMLIACGLFAVQLVVRNIMSILDLWRFDLWIFNIIFIPIFMKKFFKVIIYKHQLYSLVFNFGINLVLLIIASSAKYENEDEADQSDYEKIKQNFGSYFFIVLFYLVFIALAAILSLSQVLQKQLMDFEYISPFKILLGIGIFSTFFTLITLTITTNVKCNDNLEELCLGPKKNTRFDSFTIFGNNLKKQFKEKKTTFFLEIFLVYPLYSLACYSKYFFETMIVYHLNPNYVLISDTIFYSIKKIIFLIFNPDDTKTYIKLFGEVIALFGYFIYLEIIQFGCCEMNFNTSINIIERSKIESIGKPDEIDDDDDEQTVINDNEKDNQTKKDNEMIEVEGNDKVNDAK